MALELETQIMREIFGTTSPPSWFNGSPSCEGIRKAAAKKLPAAIRRHVDAGDPICEPCKMLMLTLELIADEADEDMCVLTRTWEACSYVIAEHIHQYEQSNRVREDAFRRLDDHLRRKNDLIDQPDQKYDIWAMDWNSGDIRLIRRQKGKR